MTDGNRQLVRIGIVSWTATYWPFYVGLSNGVFRSEGLDLELVLLGSTQAGVPALLDERIDVAATCPDAVIEAAVGGAALRIAGGLVDSPASSLVVVPDVTNWTGLRGRRIAVTQARGSVSIVLRAVLRREGLEPALYAQVVLGTTPTQAAALDRGEVDAAMLTHPFEAPLLARGFRRLAHVGQQIGSCAFTTLNVRAGWTKRPAWGRLVRALDAVDALLYDHPEHRSAVRTSLAAATGLPEETLEEACALYLDSAGVLVRGGRLDLAGLEQLLQFMREDGLSVGRRGSASDFLDAAAQVRSSSDRRDDRSP
jgi:ABC-type nitrate/sulfonate/bicarbonate transport system substrate-binding protein